MRFFHSDHFREIPTMAKSGDGASTKGVYKKRVIVANSSDDDESSSAPPVRSRSSFTRTETDCAGDR